MFLSVFLPVWSNLPLCRHTVLVYLSCLTSCLSSCEVMRGDSNGGSKTAGSPVLLCWHKRSSLPSRITHRSTYTHRSAHAHAQLQMCWTHIDKSNLINFLLSGTRTYSHNTLGLTIKMSYSNISLWALVIWDRHLLLIFLILLLLLFAFYRQIG